ncbi:MAG: hypothetical protein M1817_004275 [Caeruleum heppii]|nr:MAG: hypothetical protein M1817_004275 [Caeruleum heppii]
MAQPEAEAGGLTRTLKDLFAGAAGGVAQVLLDIVKVRLQTTSEYSNALECAAKIWKNEGPTAFYKGTLTPLVGIGACVSVQFTCFHLARRTLEARNLSSSPTTAPTLSTPQYYLAGAFAGLSNTILSSPIEHVRIRLQTQPHDPAKRLYTGPLDCIRQLTRHHGLSRGLYRGTGVTWFREAQAYGVWFATFEYLMSWDLAGRVAAHRSSTSSTSSSPSALPPPTRADIPPYMIALYGALAGEALWISSYPFDVVKSKMQSDALEPGRMRYHGMRDCFAQTWRAEGARGFWRGIGPTLLRAGPVSAGTFAV